MLLTSNAGLQWVIILVAYALKAAFIYCAYTDSTYKSLFHLAILTIFYNYACNTSSKNFTYT